MSCASFRTIYLTPYLSGAPEPQDCEQVQCIRPRGHLPKTLHRGIAEDGTILQWEGAPSDR